MGILTICLLCFIATELSFYDLNTFNMMNFFTKRNAFATLNENVHHPMIDILDVSSLKNKSINILEIGAGNGISTANFMNRLNKHKLKYNYTANEYYSSYEKDLLKVINEKHVLLLIMPFEEIYMHTTQPFDIILLTAVSAINDQNIDYLRKIINADTKIITICPYVFASLLIPYFEIIQVETCTTLLGIFVLSLHI